MNVLVANCYVTSSDVASSVVASCVVANCVVASFYVANCMGIFFFIENNLFHLAGKPVNFILLTIEDTTVGIKSISHFFKVCIFLANYLKTWAC
jgi:hypothetical protein